MACVKIPEQKVILCGEFGVGKSSLFRRFAFDTFVAANDRKSTLGLDCYSKKYTSNSDSREIKLQLFDTGGMERVASITSSYYKFSEAAILVFDLNNSDSFHSLAQHLLEVVSYAENAKIFLVGNKNDLSPEISDEDMDSFCEQCHTLISGVYKVSCKTGEGVVEMFEEIAQCVMKSSRSRIDLQTMDATESFKLGGIYDNSDDFISGQNPSTSDDNCLC